MVSGLPDGWVLTDAGFGPEADQIIATGQYGARISAFLLTVPEPDGAVAIGAWSLGVLLARRRRRREG
jgi:MYXO-CTERM domain-containing protein